jgi:hypothetical protein
MVGNDVVVLEIDLDEGLPVVVALVQFDVIQLVAVEFQLAGDLHAGQVGIRRARAAEQEPLPVLQLLLGQVETGIGREVRGADQFAARIVGPAMDRADDVFRVARALQHDGLPVAADIGHLVEAVRLACQQAPVIVPFLRAVVMHLGNHQLMADVARPGIEDQLFLQFEKLFVEIPLNRKLRLARLQQCAGADIGHDSQPPRSFTRKPETKG